MIYAKTIAERLYDKCSECPYCKLNELANADICQISNEILTDCEIRHDKCPLMEE